MNSSTICRVRVASRRRSAGFRPTGYQMVMRAPTGIWDLGFGTWDLGFATAPPVRWLGWTGRSLHRWRSSSSAPVRRASCSRRLTPIAPFSTRFPPRRAGACCAPSSAPNNPDNRTRRRQLKAMAREVRAARVRKDDDVLQATGIRTLRRKPVFTTPNVFPPENFAPRDVHEAESPWEFERRPRADASRGPALLRLQAEATRRSITSTISCARRARSSISRSAPSSPICAAASRC